MSHGAEDPDRRDSKPMTRLSVSSRSGCREGEGASGQEGVSGMAAQAFGRGAPALQPGDVVAAVGSSFARLDQECLAHLQRCAVRRTFVGGRTIHLQGDEARFLNIVTRGSVRLSHVMVDGSAILHDILPEGEMFGELGVFDRSAYSDMATAVGPVSLISLPTNALIDLARSKPDLALVLHQAVAARFRVYTDLVRDLSLKTLSARLARALIRMADRLDLQSDYQGCPALAVGAAVTQTDLGLMARGSRGNVNRALQGWQRAGWIALKDRSILVLDRAALAAVVARDQD